MEADYRAPGALMQTINSTNTAPCEKTVEPDKFVFLRKYCSFWRKKLQGYRLYRISSERGSIRQMIQMHAIMNGSWQIIADSNHIYKLMG